MELLAVENLQQSFAIQPGAGCEREALVKFAGNANIAGNRLGSIAHGRCNTLFRHIGFASRGRPLHFTASSFPRIC
jgi:hypothetical protein